MMEAKNGESDKEYSKSETEAETGSGGEIVENAGLKRKLKARHIQVGSHFLHSFIYISSLIRLILWSWGSSIAVKRSQND